MTSLFGRSLGRKKSKGVGLGKDALDSSSAGPAPSPPPPLPVDEHGRRFGPSVVSQTYPAPSSRPLSPPDLSLRNQHGASLPPLPSWSFAATYLPPPKPVNFDVGDSSWGLMCEGNDVVLGLDEISSLVGVVAAEISKRGLTTPFLFSSLALDISLPKIKLAVRSYLASVPAQGPFHPGARLTPQQLAFRQEVEFSSEKELAWVLRWALSRVLRVRGDEMRRGFVDIDLYDDWRGRERTANYPATHFHAFTASIGPYLQPLFVELFTLFSRLAAHSHAGGCTPSVIAGLFGPLLFGLPTSSPAARTHKAFTHSAIATEHLLLSFIRSQAASAHQTAGGIPGRLQDWIKGYPSMLPSDAFLSSGEPRRGTKVSRAHLVKRDCRAYSRELFRSGEVWAAELEKLGGGPWPFWTSRIILPSRPGSAINPAGPAKYSSDYKKRMHIQGNLAPLVSTAGGWEDLGSTRSAGSGRDDPDEDGQRWRSMSDKQWGSFMEGGFDAIDSSNDTISKKLAFDLTEGAKAKHSAKRETLSWQDFSSAGFSRTDAPLAGSLNFSPPVQKDISEWPEHRAEVQKRLKKFQKDLPSFDYDTRPRIAGEILLEEAFVDAWCDLLVSGGWMDRDDPTLRECNWALAQYKAVPEHARGIPFGEDPRTDDAYVVFEEVVPVEYQARLTSPKKQFALFSPKKLKKTSTEPTADAGSRRSRDKEEAFESIIHRGGGGTKLLINPARAFRSESSSNKPFLPSSTNAIPTPPINVFPSPASSGSTTPQSGVGGLLRPSQSASNVRGSPSGPKLPKSPRPDKPSKADKVHKPSKKEAKQIQPSVPLEQDLEFDMRTASGASESGDSPRNKGHTRQASKDDMWIDITVTARPRKRTTSDPAAQQQQQQQQGLALPPPPPPPAPHRPPPLSMSLAPATDPSFPRFREGDSSEVGGPDTPLSLGPALVVRHPTGSTIRAPMRDSIASDISIEPILDDDDDVPGGEVQELSVAARRAMGLPASPKPNRTENLHGFLEAQGQDPSGKRDSVVSNYSEADSEASEDTDPNTLATLDDVVRHPSPGSYQHGQPLTNLAEEEEEDEY